MSGYLNLVLQGGGVRGIAYVGALETFPDDIRIHTIGGTSAGSIVAGLLAIGQTRKDIAKIMMDLDLLAMLDLEDRKRMERLKWVVASEDKRSGRIVRTGKVIYRFLISIGST